MKSKFIQWIALLLSLFYFDQLVAQQADTSNWTAPEDRLFVESKWRYTYTLHLESNTIIHQADSQYGFYLYFRYDYTYQQLLNGNMTRGNWSLDGRNLFYSFQHVSKFKISSINKSVLVLEFNPRNSKGTYQYHFVRVDSKDAPFVRPPNELPEVIVESDSPKKVKKNKQGWLAFGKKRKERRRKKYQPELKLTYINVELIGGGYYGGIDPVIKDFIHLKTDGRLIQEYQSVNQGLFVNKKNIPREELEQFAEYVVKQNFFNFERVYDCTDPACFKRKSLKPTPIPLRLSVTYGNRKKVVTVAIWGEDERKMQYVHYPPALDYIIDAIQRMASRLDDSLVKK